VWLMAEQKPFSSEDGSRVVNFRTGSAHTRPPPTPPVEDLAKYERGEDPDDYRHRMLVNVAAFLAIVALIGIGVWLADTMATMRKNQDCVLSGRRGCSPVEVTKERW
jgi:hypothetical protein